MAKKDRPFLGEARGCSLMPAFLAALSEEMREFYKERARGSRFAPCPRHKGWVIEKRAYCDYCPDAVREKP